MSQQVIDGYEFASAGSTQQGEFPLSAFPRLRDLLASDGGSARYEVSGVRDARGRPSLRLRVQATLQLRCQRCLEPLPLVVDDETLLVLAATQAEIDADPGGVDAPDRVVAGHEMPLAQLVEDELILAVPYAPRHEACAAVAAAQDDGGRGKPFANLRSLLQTKH